MEISSLITLANQIILFSCHTVLPVPAPSLTPPRKTLLDTVSLSHTVSSRQTLLRSPGCRPQQVKVWFHCGFTVCRSTTVLCLVDLLLSGRRYLRKRIQVTQYMLKLCYLRNHKLVHYHSFSMILHQQGRGKRYK